MASKAIKGELVTPESRGLAKRQEQQFGSHNPTYLRVDMRQDPNEPGSIGFALEKERMERLNDQITADQRRMEQSMAAMDKKAKDLQHQLDEQAAYREQEERDRAKPKGLRKRLGKLISGED